MAASYSAAISVHVFVR